MNTISKCLFGGALLGAGLSSSAIGGTIEWGLGSSIASTYFSIDQSTLVSGNWSLNSTAPDGSYASSVGNEFGLSMLTLGGSAVISKDFTVTHDMFISFEWDFIAFGNADILIYDSLNNFIFHQFLGTRSSAPLELSFMAGETYHMDGRLTSASRHSTPPEFIGFTMTGGNDINVVPIPPAAFAGLGMLAGLGAYRRVRR